MATRFYLRRTQTHPGATTLDNYDDMTALQATSGTATTIPLSQQLPSERFYVRQTSVNPLVPMMFWSDRFATDFTLAGAVTFNLWTSATSLPSGRLRVRLSKITTGGSNVETPILTAEATTNLSASAVAHSFSATPSSSVVIAARERLILRVYVFNPAGGDVANTDPATLSFDSSSGTGVSWIEVTETVSTKPNGTKLYLRRTAANGIGNFFDMLETRGSSAATTGVVNTVASGTDIQWTRTAGGTLLEWISPRLKESYLGASLSNPFSSAVWVHESAAQANIALRIQVNLRQADGTEYELCRSSPNQTEFPTSSTLVNMGAGVIQQPTRFFYEDDRIVFRMFITNAFTTTMGGGRTGTVTYDHNVANATGDSYFTILNSGEFKLESDPPAQRIADGQSMSGIGN